MAFFEFQKKQTQTKTKTQMFVCSSGAIIRRNYSLQCCTSLVWPYLLRRYFYVVFDARQTQADCGLCYLCLGRTAETRLGQGRVAALGQVVQGCVRFVCLLFCRIKKWRKANNKNKNAGTKGYLVKQKHTLIIHSFLFCFVFEAPFAHVKPFVRNKT